MESPRIASRAAMAAFLEFAEFIGAQARARKDQLARGEAVPDDLMPHLFDPFVTTKPSGSGLGLALVAKIIGDHGGVIDCDSRPGRTRFRILLPVASGAFQGTDEFHFGEGASRMDGDPNFKMVVVEGCDHTFSNGAAQQVLIETVRRHLQQKLSR